jgi:hypothetical protein
MDTSPIKHRGEIDLACKSSSDLRRVTKAEIRTYDWIDGSRAVRALRQPTRESENQPKIVQDCGSIEVGRRLTANDMTVYGAWGNYHVLTVSMSGGSSRIQPTHMEAVTNNILEDAEPLPRSNPTTAAWVGQSFTRPWTLAEGRHRHATRRPSISEG